MLDAHTREPITVIPQRYLGVLHFCSRWSQPGYHQKSALFISEIRVERSHSMYCTNSHKIDITTGYCSWVEISVVKVHIYISTGTVMLFVSVYIPGIFFIWGHVHSCTVHCCYIYMCVTTAVCVCRTMFLCMALTTGQGCPSCSWSAAEQGK